MGKDNRTLLDNFLRWWNIFGRHMSASRQGYAMIHSHTFAAKKQPNEALSGHWQASFQHHRASKNLMEGISTCTQWGCALEYRNWWKEYQYWIGAGIHKYTTYRTVDQMYLGHLILVPTNFGCIRLFTVHHHSWWGSCESIYLFQKLSIIYLFILMSIIWCIHVCNCVYI